MSIKKVVNTKKKIIIYKWRMKCSSLLQGNQFHKSFTNSTFYVPSLNPEYKMTITFWYMAFFYSVLYIVECNFLQNQAKKVSGCDVT